MGAKQGRGQVWSAGRRWMGNVLPILLWLPVTGYGVYLAAKGGDMLGAPLIWIAAGQVAGWFGVALLGGFPNRAMRHELSQRLASKLPSPSTDAVFLGLSTPKHQSLSDPHEDIGFLYLLEDRLLYVGERYQMDIPRESVAEIRTRPNVHTWLGLGAWISITGENAGTPFRLSLEPRESPTAWKNQRVRKDLLARLKAWHAAK